MMADLYWKSMVEWLTDPTELELDLASVDQMVDWFIGELKY